MSDRLRERRASIPDRPRSLTIAPVAIIAVKLTPEAFAPYGTVIQNPGTYDSPTSPRREPHSDTGNQGSATVYTKISTHDSLLSLSESQAPEYTTVNLYACRPRSPVETQTQTQAQTPGTTYAVPILERHPYTTQSFIPLGLPASRPRTHAYLVIVAPTTTCPPPPPEEEQEEVVVVARDGPPIYRTQHGMPDLRHCEAFLAHGGQAITYAAGTWHAPMYAIGTDRVDFVVLQWQNGVASEAVQEVEIKVSSSSSSPPSVSEIGVLGSQAHRSESGLHVVVPVTMFDLVPT